MGSERDEGLRVSLKRSLLDAAHRSGIVDLSGRRYGRRRLTVLAYHRVIDHRAPGFSTYRRNVSATPEDFDRQMQMVADRFEPVAIGDVVAWLDGGPLLPLRPLLVTFDDGYRDNLTNALPILEAHGIPAVLFVATDHIESGIPFGWDLAAWCFAHTRHSSAELPFMGTRWWGDRRERERTLGDWLEGLKQQPDTERADAVARLPDILGVAPPTGGFSDIYLTWDEVRAMDARGVHIGAHTRTHPILTRVDADCARLEVFGSKEKVEAEVGKPAIGFAYPNGGPADVDLRVRGLVGEAGFRLAFSLVPGPARPSEVRSDPLMIRRISVHHTDRPARFAANAAGWPRFAGRFR
jgi:peptidoglycan/xylan/chitin deacetylase (PgdA/CDA1 family)